jgi:predicted RecA/RadA family phage recombinase
MPIDAIRLSDKDNVGVAIHDIAAGGAVELADIKLTALGPVPLGHKIALRHIKSGEKILKFGVPVGSATMDIPAGAHVHMHNVRSDYLTNREDHWE